MMRSQKKNSNMNGGFKTSHNGGAQSGTMPPHKPKFHCQLAHGSPTNTITGFENAQQLYKAISDAFDIHPSEILFCTLNTFKLNMEKLLGSQVAYDDMIFAHIKGSKKEVTLEKKEDVLGLTVTDNGAGYVFVKRIKQESFMAKITDTNRQLVEVGDHIEKINGQSFVGKKHLDVALYLRSLEVGSTFTLRLISPEKSEYANLVDRNNYQKKRYSNLTSKQTIRMKANGHAVASVKNGYYQSNASMEAAVKQINGIIENILGIEDDEMARSIMDLCSECRNPMSVIGQIDENFGDFQFPESAKMDIWGVVNDYNQGIINPDLNPLMNRGNRVEFEGGF